VDAGLHLVTLSFDDGFKSSSIRTAEIYEKHGLAACFNVLAGVGRPDFTGHASFKSPLGDFHLWRELAARGHEIMPHGYTHANLAELPFDQARNLIRRTLDIFEEEMPSFRSETAVFNFPFNASNAELEAWLPTVVRAFRTWGDAVNTLPSPDTVKVTCVSRGPESAEKDLDRRVEELLARPSGWLVYNTHGLDGEGWGPIGSDYLDSLLGRLAGVKSVRVAPAGRLLAEADGHA